MTPARLQFDAFVLDVGQRRLLRDGAGVELNGRYLDALALLLREQGRLVSKERFLEEVWRGVPVTDEALTQCIKTLRKALGDDAASPRFIETVPKHGYRFVAAVTVDGEQPAPVASPVARHDALVLGLAGTIGAAVAGLIGGLIYGFAAAPAAMGAFSMLLVMTCITGAIALLGGAGVAFGISLSGRASVISITGGAAGGALVGAFVKLLGLDAFALLFGHAPGDITGAPEGLVLGGAVGLGLLLASRVSSLRAGASIAALCGGVAGIAITLSGGHLMAGSLDQLARSFPDSRFSLETIGALFGEVGFGPISRCVTGGLEGALFGGCLVGAMLLAQRRYGISARP
jgi:DNA-binding winged helix-turn-helix (wHTH) protein